MDVDYCICYTKIDNKLVTNMEKILHDKEIKRAYGFSGKRRMEYIAGRLVAKNAYLILTEKKIKLSEIYIENDYLGAPYFTEAKYSCSISHDKEYAVGVAADVDMIRIGIDIQNLGSIKRQLISYYINSKEKSILSDWNVYYSEDYLFTAVWSAKEAISKLLQYGFGLFSVLEVEQIEIIQNHLAIHFRNFKNLCACIYEMGNSLIAVAAYEYFWNKRVESPIILQELKY